MTRWLTTVILLTMWIPCCGAPPPPPRPNIRALLRTAEFDDALAEAEYQANANSGDLQTLILLAASRAAVAAPSGAVESAADAAVRAVGVGSRGRAAEAFTAEVTGSQAFQEARFVAAARVMAAIVEAWEAPPNDSDARLGASALLELAAYGADHEAPMGAVGPLVEFALNLLEVASNDLVFPDNEMHEAWVCFRSAGVLADSTYRAGSPGIARATAELAIRIAEANRERLAIPVACDLSSPRGRLRETLRRRHDADSLRRLSTVLEASEGCVIGTYAP